MNIKNLAKQYYEAILKYEDFLSKYRVNYQTEKIADFSEIQNKFFKEIQKVFRHEYEERYLPWRLVKGDIQKHLEKAFTSKKSLNIYMGVEDGISDDLDLCAENDLNNYYKAQGYDLENDFVKEHIEMETMLVCDVIFNEERFSKETLDLIKVKKDFEKVCKQLLEQYKSLESEKESEEIEQEEIEK